MYFPCHCELNESRSIHHQDCHCGEPCILRTVFARSVYYCLLSTIKMRRSNCHCEESASFVYRIIICDEATVIARRVYYFLLRTIKMRRSNLNFLSRLQKTSDSASVRRDCFASLAMTAHKTNDSSESRIELRRLIQIFKQITPFPVESID